jgi:hypothetical protein
MRNNIKVYMKISVEEVKTIIYKWQRTMEY